MATHDSTAADTQKATKDIAAGSQKGVSAFDVLPEHERPLTEDTTAADSEKEIQAQVDVQNAILNRTREKDGKPKPLTVEVPEA
jgi:hypothetical protein